MPTEQSTPAANANTAAAPVVTPSTTPVAPATPAPVAPTKADATPAATPVADKAPEAVRSPLDPDAISEPIKTDEKPKTEEVKPEASQEAAVFDDKDLKLPEGFKLDSERDKPILDLLKGAKMSKEHAQTLVDRYATGIKEAVTAVQQEGAKKTNAYFDQSLNSLKNDPTLGGKNFEATIQGNKKVIDAVASRLSPALQTELKAAIYGVKENGFNGLGKSHAFNAFLAEIHKAGFVEAKSNLGNTSSGQKTQGLSTAQVMSNPRQAMRDAGIISSKK